MKAPATKKHSSNVNSHSSKPFFTKNGEGSFFSQSQETEQPFFSPYSIQPKLTIGQPNDPYEQEANTMAEKVVGQIESSKPNPSIQTRSNDYEQEEKLQKKEEEESEKELMRKPVFASNGEPPDNPIQTKSCAPQIQLSPNLETNLQSSKGNGSPILQNIRQKMESGFVANFENVRIHTDDNAVQMNQELGAKAFTNEADIYFNKGMYDTGSNQGKKLLAHELTHVLQQNGTESRINEPGINQTDSKRLQKENSFGSKPTKSVTSNLVQRQEHLPRRPRMVRPSVVSATALDSFVRLRFNMPWTRDEAVSFLWPNGPRQDVMFFRPDESDPWKTNAGEYERYLILPESSVLQGILQDVHRMIYESIPEFNAQTDLPTWVPDEIKTQIQASLSSEGNIHIYGRWPPAPPAPRPRRRQLPTMQAHEPREEAHEIRNRNVPAQGLYWVHRRGSRIQIEVTQLPDPSIAQTRRLREARITVNQYMTSYVASEGMSISEAKTRARQRSLNELVISILEAIQAVIPSRLPHVAAPRPRRPGPTASRARQPRTASTGSRLRQMIGDEVYEAHRQAIEAIKSQHRYLASIPKEDLIALRIYTTGEFGKINLALRQADPARLAELQPYLERARAGLRELPAYEGVAYASRSMTDDMLSAYQPGEIVEELAFTSASKPGTQAASREGNIAFTYRSMTGRDISNISATPAEGEILFAPNTRFRVQSVKRVGNARIIHLQEVQ